jgi:oligoendopeptidase F
MLPSDREQLLAKEKLVKDRFYALQSSFSPTHQWHSELLACMNALIDLSISANGVLDSKHILKNVDEFARQLKTFSSFPEAQKAANAGQEKKIQAILNDISNIQKKLSNQTVSTNLALGKILLDIWSQPKWILILLCTGFLLVMSFGGTLAWLFAKKWFL